MSRQKILSSLQNVPFVKKSVIDQAMSLILGEADLNAAGPIDAYGEFRELVNEYIVSLCKNLNELKEAKEALEKVIQSADEMLMEQMRFHHEDAIEGSFYSFLRHGCKKRVLVLDEAKIPFKFHIIKTIIQIDKEAVRKAIESGEDVPGAALDGGEYISPKCKNNV